MTLNVDSLSEPWPNVSRKGIKGIKENASVTVKSMGDHLAGPQTAVLRCRVAKSSVERCESGRIDMLGKHASQQWDRGFESHPLRQREVLRTGCCVLRLNERERLKAALHRLSTRSSVLSTGERGWALCDRTL